MPGPRATPVAATSTITMPTRPRSRRAPPARKRLSGRPAPKVRPQRSGPVRVELISVGRELLRGKIADGNAQRVARLLTQKGVWIRRIAVVDDSAAAVADAVREALARDPHLVITTGGLGPADDDRTLAGVGQALELPLTFDHRTKVLVEEAYAGLARRGVAAGGLTATREKLCHIPIGGTAVPNPLGVSPGVFVRLPGGAVVLALPGMPDEMQAVLESALPQLGIHFEGEVALREVESPTADESALAPLLDRLAHEFPSVWIQSRPSGSRKTGGRIVIRVEATGDTRAAADTAVDGCVRRLLALAAGVV